MFTIHTNVVPAAFNRLILKSAVMIGALLVADLLDAFITHVGMGKGADIRAIILGQIMEVQEQPWKKKVFSTCSFKGSKTWSESTNWKVSAQNL